MAGPVDEALAASTPLAGTLAAGVEQISADQEITFELYDRRVLPADGYVFWLKRAPAKQLVVKGSLHYATTNTQDEAANISTNYVVFTALGEVNDLNEVAPGTMWIATYTGKGNSEPLKIAFSARASFYEQAGLFHYRGTALLADAQTQVIDDPADLPNELIISNSLPIWLFLSKYQPFYGFANPFELYPSFLVPDDLDPSTPYGAVDIKDGDTEALQGTSRVDATSSSFQLCRDRVRITLLGGTNKQAIDFVNCVNQYSVDYDTLGIMNVPVPRDVKRTQAEFSILGMKKIIEFEVSYYQQNVEAVGRDLIKKAAAALILKPV